MKDYRENEMRHLMLMLVFLFLLLCTPILQAIETPADQTSFNILIAILESSVITGCISSATIVIDCFFSSSTKDKLVGLFFIPRAGETVFTKLKNGKIKDDRFLLSDAQHHYKAIIEYLPSKTSEKRKYENSRWYAVYRKHQEKGQISQSQKDYLMCRDMYVEVLVFTFVYLASLLVFPEIIAFSKKFFTILLALAVMLNIATHQKMNRFVNTVLAVDITSCVTEHTNN